MEDSILLDIQELTVEYHTDEATIFAVNDVNLRINKSETLGLVGETGAGKTTIAKSIMRILPVPQAKLSVKSIRLEQTELTELSEREMRNIRGKQIAMIFQDPMTALNPIEKIGFQIAETIKQHEKVSKAEANRRACDMLELVGIPMDRFDEYPHQFSGGMKQRVVIALALACNPTLLIADEPTTALDVTIQAQVLGMMRSLKKELGTSVLLITHDLGVVAEFCDSVAVMYAGEIVERGTTRHIFKNALHPYTRGLFDSLPKLDATERRLKPIKGLMPDPTKLPEGCPFFERCPNAAEQCEQTRPPDVEVEPWHVVRCFFAMGGK